MLNNHQFLNKRVGIRHHFQVIQSLQTPHIQMLLPAVPFLNDFARQVAQVDFLHLQVIGVGEGDLVGGRVGVDRYCRTVYLPVGYGIIA